jgi:protein-tyrosine kinase
VNGPLPHAALDERQATHSVPPLERDSTFDSTMVHDRSIGNILTQLRKLTADQVEQVLMHQRNHGARFGEAAVALNLVSRDDVLFALARQFHYPYAPHEHQVASAELVALREPFSLRAEAFRALRSTLMMRLYGNGEPRRALAVVSPETGDGKTYCAANLAVCLAQLGGRTLLVDADLRGPRQHQVFALDNSAGLSSLLSGRSDSKVIHQVDSVPTLFVLPVGVMPPNPQELVERPAFGMLIDELAGKFDHVIVDTPAASFGADALVIAARCRSALVVARRHASRLHRLQGLVASMNASAVRVAGAVYNEF